MIVSLYRLSLLLSLLLLDSVGVTFLLLDSVVDLIVMMGVIVVLFSALIIYIVVCCCCCWIHLVVLILGLIVLYVRRAGMVEMVSLLYRNLLL